MAMASWSPYSHQEGEIRPKYSEEKGTHTLDALPAVAWVVPSGDDARCSTERLAEGTEGELVFSEFGGFYMRRRHARCQGAQFVLFG